MADSTAPPTTPNLRRPQPISSIRPQADNTRGLHPTTLILGLGNDLLTDDSIGLRVAESLEELFKDESRICVRKSGEAGLALLDLIVGFEVLVIVDAIQTGKAHAGCLHRFDPGDLKALSIRSPHFVGVAEVLSLGHALGLAMPNRVRILGIETCDPFTVGESLTPELGAALPNLVSWIADEARRFALPARF